MRFCTKFCTKSHGRSYDYVEIAKNHYENFERAIISEWDTHFDRLVSKTYFPVSIKTPTAMPSMTQPESSITPSDVTQATAQIEDADVKSRMQSTVPGYGRICDQLHVAHLNAPWPPAAAPTTSGPSVTVQCGRGSRWISYSSGRL